MNTDQYLTYASYGFLGLSCAATLLYCAEIEEKNLKPINQLKPREKASVNGFVIEHPLLPVKTGIFYTKRR